MDKKRCFLIGHHDAPESIYPALQREIERHITELDVTEFIVGRYGNFDRMAARALVTAKQIHPEIFLWLLLPYHPAEQKVKAPEGFDGSLYPEGLERVPRRIAIVRANRSVVDHVHFLIAYIRHPGSNTQKLFEYANKKKLQSSLL
ncbi:hypothetical protein INF35_06650 [Subdoligranulum sp. DSM 109015]|uniref:Sirohydrochlorin cobaltochelatase n=1 Tax=Gemmiger gallinarum TaxID=2779354 RepID=A0ABR9R2S7_9FIRM|nr:hypothetical protein [Gemmiger gallinarum]MBE5037458.1 hypothetical protein [Gemmiger gallinarum]